MSTQLLVLAVVMVLNLPFHNITNSTVNVSNFTKDYSGHNNHGNVSGATFNASGGQDGFGAYMFDGNDVISVSDSESLDVTNELSISVWVKPIIDLDEMIFWSGIVFKGAFSDFFSCYVVPLFSSRKTQREAEC